MSKTVLVVDDESMTRSLVTHALKALDVEVVGAGDGFHALELATEHELALAILDINLPGMDGFELLEKLKSDPATQHIPVVIFTARNQPGDQQTARHLGAAGFMYKPFTTQELRQIVSDNLLQD